MKSEERTYFIRDNLWLTLAHALLNLKRVILLPILLGHLELEVYGYYVVLIIFIEMLNQLSSLGIGFYYRRFLPAAATKIERRDLFSVQFLFHLGMIGVCSLLVWEFGGALDRLLMVSGASYNRWLLVSYLVSMFLWSQSNNYFRLSGRIRAYGLGLALQPYLMILAVLVLLRVTGSVTIDSILLSNTLSFLAIGIPYFVRIYLELGSLSFHVTPSRIIHDLQKGFPLVGQYLSDFLLANADKYILAFMLTTTAVAYYNPAYVLGSFALLLPRIMNPVLQPYLSRLADSRNHDDALRLLAMSMRYQIIIMALFVTIVFATASDILTLIAPKAVTDDTQLVAGTVAIGILFYSLGMTLSNYLFVKLDTRTIFVSNLMGGLLNVLLNVLFLMLYRSILVPAIVTAISYAVMFAFIFFKVRKISEYRLPPDFVIRVLSISVVAGLLAYFVQLANMPPLIALILSVFAGGLSYVILLFVAGEFSKDDPLIRWIVELLPR